MEEDKWTFWKKVWLVIEALVGLFVIWILCSIFTVLLTWIVMGIKYGECTALLLEENLSYIRIGYTSIIAICFSVYLRRLYKKYNFKE